MAVIERIRDELKLPILYVSHDRIEVDRLATQVVPLDG
jgi:molybdate transport system ATP-binding protein